MTEAKTNPFDEPVKTDDKAPAEKKAASKPKAPRKPAAKKAEAEAEADFGSLDYEAFPLSAVSGNVTGVVKVNGAVPIFELALVGWIGEAPVSIAASEIDDVVKVVEQLKEQAKG